MKIRLISQGIIFIPIIVSIIIYILNNRKVNYLVFVNQIILTVSSIFMWSHLIYEDIISIPIGGWNPSIGIELKIDNISMLFITMAIIIWWVILIYSWNQKKGDFKFLFFLMFLEGTFIAFVQSNDFFTLFILIELVTILSSILIIYKKDGISVKAGLYYLLFNSFGMAIYLLGLILLYIKFGTLNMTLIEDIFKNSDMFSDPYSIIKISYASFIVAMCIKAALFPVYEWLPRAHTAAPSHISALLSALLVKSGLFGLIRILDVFNYNDIYSMLFFLGFFTGISGIAFAISQKDIKGILAFSTISQIGLIIMSFSTQTELGVIGSYVHIFNHFLFKSLLFLGAGIIINEYGVRRVNEIRGIGKSHPILTFTMFIGIFSITGAPLSIGYLSKSLIKYGMYDYQIFLFYIVNIGTIITYIKFSKIFLGKPIKTNKIKKSQITGIVLLSLICIIAFFSELKFVPIFMGIDNIILKESTASKLLSIISSSFSLNAIFQYVLMVILGSGLYMIIIRFKKTLSLLRQFRMKFPDAIISLMFFLVLVLQIVK